MFYIILFIIVSLSEVYLMIKIGRLVGALYTTLILFATAIIGIILARLEGYALVNRIKKEFTQGALMTDSVIEVIFVFLGAFLMVLPGFLTDIIGFLFIIPPTRRYFTARVGVKFRSKIEEIIEKKKKEIIEKGKLKNSPLQP
ncbi:MAG: FxsA family protein [Candidatus Omnitrophica bacterium]|nr:FxsA family protein [Candidatus Omnitrophota bacterium]